MSRLIAVIEGCEIWEEPNGRVWWISDMDIDCDGSGGNPDHDPYFQPDTSLHHNGKALDAYKEKYGVVPPAVVNGVKGVVLGAQMKITYLRTMKGVPAVCGDTGPTKKLGEASPAVASAIGINPNPNHGGEDGKFVLYEIWPGVPAMVDGIRYELQPKG